MLNFLKSFKSTNSFGPFTHQNTRNEDNQVSKPSHSHIPHGSRRKELESDEQENLEPPKKFRDNPNLTWNISNMSQPTFNWNFHSRSQKKDTTENMQGSHTTAQSILISKLTPTTEKYNNNYPSESESLNTTTILNELVETFDPIKVDIQEEDTTQGISKAINFFKD